MQDTLFSGDLILVSKRNPSVPFAQRLVNDIKCRIIPDSSGATKVQNNQIKDNPKYKRNDIIIIKQNKDDVEYIKRCIGLPGDTISFHNQAFFINHSNLITNIPTIRSRYRIYTKNLYLFLTLLDSMKLLDQELLQQKNYLFRDLTLNVKQVNFIKHSSLIDSAIIIKPREFDSSTFLYKIMESIDFYTNTDNSFIIPYKGFKIIIDNKNIAFYSGVLNKFESENLQPNPLSHFNNSNLTFSHIFESNYYFVLGDNAPMSIDSRDWGLIPESKIRGTTFLIISSKSNFIKHDKKLISFPK